MKKACSVILLFILIIGSMVPVFAEGKPQITAEAALLIDASNGRVLFEKNAEKVMYPASTTKIMTALVALDAIEKGEISLDQPLVFSEKANSAMDIDGSNIALKVGEEMRLENLLQGLLIASGNDAAACIAEGISGTMDAFVVKMNEKAAQLKLKDTHFMNPHGLHNKEHYTTAHDLARLAREAMKNETFRSIVECAHIYLPETNMSEKRYYINTNNLVSRMRYPYYFYDKATGIKTGSTDEAGSCLVASAEHKGKSVIAVVLKASDMSVSHNETKAILEYGLNGFSLAELVTKDDIIGEIDVKQAADGTDHILLAAETSTEAMLADDEDREKIETVLDIPEKVYAPIKTGQVIGKVRYVYEGQELGSVNLVSTANVKRHFLGFLMSFGEWLWSFRTVKVIVFTVLGLALGFVILVTVGLVRAVKKSKRKKRRTSKYTPPRY